jgi:hypothetical protein
MSTYYTLSLQVVFKQNTPAYITDFFQKGIVSEKLPSFITKLGITFDNEINLIVPETYLSNYGAKIYIDDVPQNKLFYNLLVEFDIDFYSQYFYLITFLASYAEDNNMAGFIKCEDGETTLIALENGLPYYLHNLKVDRNSEIKKGKLDYFELCAIGQKIKFAEGTEHEIESWMQDFDANVPRPKGSSLFFYPANYEDGITEIANYNPSVEEVVELCLAYKPIQL